MRRPDRCEAATAGPQGAGRPKPAVRLGDMSDPKMTSISGGSIQIMRWSRSKEVATLAACWIGACTMAGIVVAMRGICIHCLRCNRRLCWSLRRSSTHLGDSIGLLQEACIHWASVIAYRWRCCVAGCLDHLGRGSRSEAYSVTTFGTRNLRWYFGIAAIVSAALCWLESRITQPERTE